MRVVWNEVPEYADALARENAQRDSAFVLAHHDLCGIRVLPFSLRHLLILDSIGDPFIHQDRIPNPADIGRFLWVVSRRSGFHHIGLRRWWFLVQVRQTYFLNIVRAIGTYLEDAFADCPGGAGVSGSPSDYSSAAVVIDVLAREYHWHEQDILDIPLARLWQYFRAIRRYREPNCVFINPRTDKAKREHWQKILRN